MVALAEAGPGDDSAPAAPTARPPMTTAATPPAVSFFLILCLPLALNPISLICPLFATGDLPSTDQHQPSGHAEGARQIPGPLVRHGCYLVRRKDSVRGLPHGLLITNNILRIFWTSLTSNCQDLWIRVVYAASGSASSPGRSMSLPLMKVAPARTRATRWGPLTGPSACLGSYRAPVIEGRQERTASSPAGCGTSAGAPARGRPRRYAVGQLRYASWTGRADTRQSPAGRAAITGPRGDRARPAPRWSTAPWPG